jgi:hypothetical protein
MSDMKRSQRKLCYHVTCTRTVPSILRRGLEPKIGPRSRKMGESLEAVYLFPDRDTVDDALMNWLGDEFPDDAASTMLEVSVPADARLIESPAEFELVVADRIQPDLIRVLDVQI